MRRTSPILVLSLAAAACAQESSYTGPKFNPSEAPYFAYNSLVFPTTQTTLPAIQPTDAFSVATTISGIILPTTMRESATASESRSMAISVSSVSASASRTAASTSASAPPQQSTAAAVANRAGVVGAVAGGLLAGLVLA